MENVNEDVKKKLAKDSATNVVLSKPFDFEGKRIEEIDFSKLAEFTTVQLEEINDKYYLSGGSGKGIIETDLLWVKMAVQQAGGYSLELLDKLNIRDAIRLKNRVSGFFYNLV